MSFEDVCHVFISLSLSQLHPFCHRMIDSLVSLSISVLFVFCSSTYAWRRKLCRQLMCVYIYRLDFALRLTVMIISQDETKSDRYSLACKLFFLFAFNMSTSVNKKLERKTKPTNRTISPSKISPSKFIKKRDLLLFFLIQTKWEKKKRTNGLLTQTSIDFVSRGFFSSLST